MCVLKMIGSNCLLALLEIAVGSDSHMCLLVLIGFVLEDWVWCELEVLVNV